MLTTEQDKKALELLEDYIANGEKCYRPDLKKEVLSKEIDEKRLEIIQKIKSLLYDFSNRRITLEQFKRSIDSINKKYRLWGFKGINGMMFFNMTYNSFKKVGFLPDLHNVLIETIALPNTLDEVKEKIQRFVTFIENINELLLTKGISKRQAPRRKSSLFFLSYFWQIQDSTKYPIFYNSLENAFKNLGFITESKNLDNYYEAFVKLNYHLIDLFQRKLNERKDLWYVEHVFWHFYNAQKQITTEVMEHPPFGPIIVPDELLPPKIADLPLVAKNDESIQSKYTGKELEDVFEDKIYWLFKFMKFDVDKLGRGIRGPDGIAKNRVDHYAIIYDCKSRKDKFTLRAGDERTIIEYIQTNQKTLKKEGLDTIYFMIISSDFNVTNKQLRKIKTDSKANSVVLITAEQLLSIFKHYIMNPDIDKSDMEELFSITKLIEEQDIQEILTGA